MTKKTKANVQQASKQYVMKQLQHIGTPSTIRRQDVRQAIAKVRKVLLEVEAAQQAAMSR